MRVKYPFSFELVLTCYKRLYEGEEYPIAIYGHSKEQAAEILFAFIKLYESIEFAPSLLMKYGYQHMLAIDFSNYNVEIPIKKDMKDLIVKILQDTNSNGCNNKTLLKTFITLFESEYIDNFYKDQKITTKAIEAYKEFMTSFKQKCKNTTMKRIPKFVGAEILYSEYDKVKSMLLQALEGIQDKFFSTKESDINTLIESIKDESLWKDNSSWRVPSFWHITSYYIGKKNTAPDSNYLKEFKEGINISIDCEVLLYVPERLVMGILCCPELSLHHSYKVPSAVWLLNKGNMILAREVCEQLFEDSKMLYNKYLDGSFKTPEPFSSMYTIKIGKEEKECYVIKLYPKITLKAITKFFYS